MFQDIAATKRHIEETERLSSSRSWPATFMEYKEREIAYNHQASYVLIDGPLITQNLLTQTEGQNLYGKMLAANRKFYVGVTKDLRFANTEERYEEALALLTGELFIRNTEYNVIKNRLEKDYRGAVKTWSEDYLRDIFRGIYKPGRYRSGFLCDSSPVTKFSRRRFFGIGQTSERKQPYFAETEQPMIFLWH